MSKKLKVSQGMVEWLASGRRGVSSNTMFTHLTGINALRDCGSGSHPHDPDDLDRCLQLLHDVKELRPLLPKMAEYSREWAALIEHWDQIEIAHLNEVGLGWTKARSAPKTYAVMRSILDPLRGTP